MERDELQTKNHCYFKQIMNRKSSMGCMVAKLNDGIILPLYYGLQIERGGIIGDAMSRLIYNR